ncbi:MAG: hypothetical protein H5T36_00340 [Methanobacteriaceae archaeon]|nr:hypothetical protein [Methanobacteriaceae archaeon]
MEKATKVLLLACLFLVGALGFTIGTLIQMGKIPELPFLHKKPVNNTTSNDTIMSKEAEKLQKSGWDVGFCPYCGAPLAYVNEVPYKYENGITYGHIYRVYQCGHVVYMGEKIWHHNMMEDYSDYSQEYSGYSDSQGYDK